MPELIRWSQRSLAAVSAVLVLALPAAGCRAAPPRPADLDTRNETCSSCRMAVSDRHSAGQLVAPGEEPRFFDDIGCLRKVLASAKPVPGAVAFVADHRTGAWVDASKAVYVYNAAVETPMSSHLLAYSDAASRDADPAAAGGRPMSAAEVFAAAAVPAGHGHHQ